jgi:hypothetical protein
MGTTLKGNGGTIKHVAKVFIYTLTVLNMREIGWMIYNMGLVLNLGQIQRDMKDNIKMVKRKDMENIFGLMDQFTLGIGVIINFLDSEYIYGQMVE